MHEVKYIHYNNTDKFRQPALHFQKYGYYTAAPRGTTEFKQYWDKEIERSIYGFTADDGDHITGYHYFYLNYCQIMLVREKEITKPNGEKRITNIRVKDFPDFWDYDKEFFDAVEQAEVEGQHMSVLKKRGSGYSFKCASMLNRNYFLIPGSVSYAIASETEFLTRDGILSKAWDMMDFVDNNTAWTKKRQKFDTKMHKRASFLVNHEGTPIEKGYKSEIIGISLKNDPQKARGKRGKLILWEEAGKFPHLLDAWQVARPSVEQGGMAYGTMIAFGTGGTQESDYGSLEELFYKPDAYNILPINNIWDEGADGQKSGFFVPEYVNLEGYMDEEGNSLIQDAIEFAKKERAKVEENASDRHAVDRYIAERPFNPQEAVLRLSGNIFPKKELQEQLARLQTDKKLQNYKQVGELVHESDGGLKWVQTTGVKDITKFPLDQHDYKEGAIVIWEHPPKEIPYGLYVAGCDPYDHDQSSTSSLGSTFIYKRFQSFEEYYDILVAEYTGRPDTAEEYYENVLKLLKYYNARLLYENEKKGLYAYFSNQGHDYLLANQPDIISDIVNKSSVERRKGIHMNKDIKAWGEREIKDWLNTRVSPETKNLHRIMSIPLLKELISYNDQGNFDRCVVKDTKVSTIEGFKNIQDITLNDKVITHKGNIKDIELLDSHVTDRNILKFKVVGNYEPLIVTDNHPIYAAFTNTVRHSTRIKALNNIGFVNAGELKHRYQFVLQPKRKLGKELKWPTKYYYDDNMMYLLGWYVSDGYINGNQIKFCLQYNQMEIAEKLKSLLNIYGESKGKIYNNRQYEFNPATIKVKGNHIIVSRGSEELSKALEAGGGKSNNKILSKDVYNSPNTLMLAVGYLEGDGHQKKYSKYDGYKREVIECSSIYENLVKQIRQILIDNGIWSSIRYIKSKNGKSKPQYNISINRKYINRIAKYSIKFKEIDEVNLVNKNYQYETDEGFWTPIKYEGIIEDYNDKVYNLEVKEDHSYLASNIAVHNCMALMMVMIYKQELYKVHIKDKTKDNKVDPFFKTTWFGSERKLNFNKR